MLFVDTCVPEYHAHIITLRLLKGKD
jgi:hypothetical protein